MWNEIYISFSSFIICEEQVMEAVPHLFQPGVDVLDKLEALLVPVHEAECVLLRLDSDQLLVLPSRYVGGLAAHLRSPAGNIEEHSQVQRELCLLLVVVPDEGVTAGAPPGELTSTARIVNLLLPPGLLVLAVGRSQLVQSQAGEV